MKATVRPYTGAGFILSASGQLTEIGKPRLHTRAATRTEVAPAPARQASTIRAELIYAERRQAVQNAVPTEPATKQNIFQADGAAAVYSARGNRT